MSAVAGIAVHEADVRPHPLLVSSFLHLAPGAAVLGAYLALLPGVRAAGLPSNVALLVAFLAIGAPLLVGLLARAARGPGGRFPAVRYRERLAWPRSAWLVAGLSLWLLVVSSVLGPLEQTLQFEGMFSWVPADLRLDDLATAGPTGLAVVTALSLVANVVVPAAEELYFRGYLLPRLPLGGRAAVLVNTLLFSLYHFWLPWQFASRVVGLLPMVASVRRSRSVAIGIVVHVIVNSTGTLALFAMLLANSARQ